MWVKHDQYNVRKGSVGGHLGQTWFITKNRDGEYERNGCRQKELVTEGFGTAAATMLLFKAEGQAKGPTVYVGTAQC